LQFSSKAEKLGMHGDNRLKLIDEDNLGQIVPKSLALYGHSTYGTTSELGMAEQQFVR
jgi:hypothetical protein